MCLFKLRTILSEGRNSSPAVIDKEKKVYDVTTVGLLRDEETGDEANPGPNVIKRFMSVIY